MDYQLIYSDVVGFYHEYDANSKLPCICPEHVKFFKIFPLRNLNFGTVNELKSELDQLLLINKPYYSKIEFLEFLKHIYIDRVQYFSASFNYYFSMLQFDQKLFLLKEYAEAQPDPIFKDLGLKNQGLNLSDALKLTDDFIKNMKQIIGFIENEIKENESKEKALLFLTKAADSFKNENNMSASNSGTIDGLKNYFQVLGTDQIAEVYKLLQSYGKPTKQVCWIIKILLDRGELKIPRDGTKIDFLKILFPDHKNINVSWVFGVDLPIDPNGKISDHLYPEVLNKIEAILTA